jgi:hypothetical protein
MVNVCYAIKAVQLAPDLKPINVLVAQVMMFSIKIPANVWLVTFLVILVSVKVQTNAPVAILQAFWEVITVVSNATRPVRLVQVLESINASPAQHHWSSTCLIPLVFIVIIVAQLVPVLIPTNVLVVILHIP